MPEAHATHTHTSDALVSAGENRRMFDAIAPRYDLMNRLLSLGLDRWWRRAAVRALAPVSGRRYLDLGCGTGDLAFAIARRAPGATVLGIDPAERMLAGARRRLARMPAAGISFHPGDAAALDLPDALLDGVIAAFCVRNFTDRRRAWTEVIRTLAPGGRLVILELTRPRGRMMRLVHRAYTRWFVPALGSVLADRQAYQYLFDSVERFASPECIVNELRDAGFASPNFRQLNGGVVTLFVTLRPDMPAAIARVKT